MKRLAFLTHASLRHPLGQTRSSHMLVGNLPRHVSPLGPLQMQSPSHIICPRMLSSLRSPNDLGNEDYEEFHRMISKTPIPGTRFFNEYFSKLVRMKKYRSVLDLSRVLESLVAPDQITLNIRLNCFCKVGFQGQAFSILGLMYKLGLEPNISTYRPLIMGFCNSVNFVSALDMIRKIGEEGIMVDVKMFNMMIEALCKNDKLDDALGLFRDMQEKGIRGDIYTYNSLTRSLCKADRFPEAETMLTEMERKGVTPDAVFYSGIMDCYAKKGMIQAVNENWQKMVSKGIKPNVRHYNSVIEGYCKAKNIGLAKEVFRQMLSPNEVTYNIMLHGLLQAEECDAAMDLLSRMGNSADMYTHRIMLIGLCDNKKYTSAWEFFKSLQNHEAFFDTKMNTIMLEGLFKDKKIKEACELFFSLPWKGIQIDMRIYNVMIYGFCKRSMTSMAEMMISKLIQEGFSLDGCSYNPWIRAYVRNVDIAKAEKLIIQMHNSGFQAEDHTIAMIRNMESAGKLPGSELSSRINEMESSRINET